MNIRVGGLLATFCMLGILFEISAQRETAVSRQYTMDDGLPEAAVNGVLQDSRGFIWLATYNGLTKFDGYKFTTYQHSAASETSLGHNHVNSLWEDRKGRLWVAHRKGVELFDPQTEEFRFLGPDTVSPDLGVSRLRERRDGKLWMCGYGVFIADPETLSLKRMTGLPADDYSDIAETVNGSIWAAGAHSVVHIDGKTGNTSVYHPDPENRFGSSSFTIYTDEQERVWIGSNGLFLFDPDKKSFTGFMTSNHVRHIVGYSDGKLLVGHGHGLFLFDPDTGKHDTISEGWSTSVLKDKQGIIWHSSLKGLNKIKPQLKNFRVQKTFGNIFSIEKDGNQDIWMGTTKGEFRFNSSFSEILAFARPSASGPLSFMGADNEGSVYFTRSPNKFKKYDFRSKIISVEQTMPVADEFVISLFVDSFGHAWLGGWQGVRRYDPKTRSVDTLPALIAATVYCFLENSYKNLWIGTGSGLIRYNLVTGDFILIRNDPADNKSLSDNTVFHMTMDEAKNIWIGTDRGLNKLVIGTENGKPEFIRWTAGTSGLPDDNVFCIVEDEDRTVWLACGNNISHFDPEKNNFRNYGPDAYRTDGLAGTPFRNAQYLGGKAVRTSDGKIIFAIYGGGLVIFHPDSLVDNSHVPPVVITDFLIGNQRVPVAKSEADTLDWETPLPKAIPYTGAMKLPYHQNDFSFEFAALNFINPKNNPI